MQNFKQQKHQKSYLLGCQLADCAFIVGGMKFKCHKYIMASSCPYFKCLLYGDFKEAKSPDDIVLKQVNPKYFKRFMQWAYFKDKEKLKSWSIVELLGVLDLSRMYIAEELENALQDLFKNHMSRFSNNDLIKVFRYGNDKSDEVLKQQSGNVILLRAKESLTEAPQGRGGSSHFQLLKSLPPILTCSEISTLMWPIFYELLCLLRSNVPEVIRFCLIDTYIKANKLLEFKEKDGSVSKDKSTPFKQCMSTENLFSNEAIVYMFVHSIEYKEMTAEEFGAGPGMSVLLDPKEKFNIFNEICKRQKKQTDDKISTLSMEISLLRAANRRKIRKVEPYSWPKEKMSAKISTPNLATAESQTPYMKQAVEIFQLRKQITSLDAQLLKYKNARTKSK